MAQTVRCLPAIQDTRARSLGQEDALEKEMATHSSTLAGKIPWKGEPCKLQSMGSQRVGHNCVTSLHFKNCLVLCVCHIPETDTMLYVHHISIKLEKRRRENKEKC